MLEGIGSTPFQYHFPPPQESGHPPATSPPPGASKPSTTPSSAVRAAASHGNWTEVQTLVESQISTLDAEPSDKGGQLTSEYLAHLADLVTSIHGASTARKLDSLTAALKGQSPRVIAQTLRDPSVKSLLQAEAKWIAQPYTHPAASPINPLSFGPPQPSAEATSEAATRLADAVQGLPPAYAAQILRDSLPTIQKIASYNPSSGLFALSGPNTPAFSKTFANVSRAVDALDNSPGSQALISQIAHAYVGQFNSSPSPYGSPSPSTRFDKPNTGAIPFALAHGASPRLALALADKLASAGQTDTAYALVNSALKDPLSRIQNLQATIDHDVNQYTALTQDLDWAINSTQGMLTTKQTQQAISKYIQGDSSLRTKLPQLTAQMKADLGALDDTIAQLKGLPSSLRGFAAGTLNSVGQDATTQKAVAFVAVHDPEIFAGGADSSGSVGLAFWADQGGRDHDLTSALTSAYLVNNVMPAFNQLRVSHDDPAAVARVNAVLDDLQTKSSGLLGIPQDEVDKSVGELREILSTATQKGNGTDLTELVTKQVEELKELPFSSGVAGGTFHLLGASLAIAATVGQIGVANNTKSMGDIVGAFSQAAAVSSSVANAVSIGIKSAPVSSGGSIANLGDAAETFGEAADKLAGGLDVYSFLLNSGDAFSSHDYVAGTLNAVGAGGAALALVGEGSALGPIGTAVAIFAAGGLYLESEHAEMSHNSRVANTFLQDAGLQPAVAGALSSDSLQEASQIQQQLGLSASQLQNLAAQHPEVLNSGKGYAQDFIAVASASGVSGSNVAPFLSAVAHDNPNYLARFASWNDSSAFSGPAKQAYLYQALVGTSPSARSFLQQHLPQVTGAVADARRQADEDYALNSGYGPGAVATLLKNNSNQAYQAEIIELMQKNGTMANWVKVLGTSFSGSLGGVDHAILAAEKAGVLSSKDADRYLGELG
jgi:hypothetical protein